jgi:DNA-binding NtrC family response regulator
MVILVAEDDGGVQSFVGKLLRAAGFTVLTAGDGNAALEESRSYSGTIDLLLSDMDMPLMGGLQLCQNIVAERPGIKVLMMSGGLQGIEQVRMKGLPFLQKPFTASAMRGSIKTLLSPIPPLQ